MMSTASRRILTWLLSALAWAGSGAHADVPSTGGATVLLVASERLTDLALNYAQVPQVARLGFGSPQKPWHAWFGGGIDMRTIVHLPAYQPGQAVRPQAPMIIGNRFQGKVWDSGLAALASFDRDGNGIVEGQEMRDLYVWVDFTGDGQLAPRADALRPAIAYYSGFDLRGGLTTRKGFAREGRLAAFSVLVPYGTRVHLLELDVSASYPTLHAGYLSTPGSPASDAVDPKTPLNGWWRWKITNADRWKDPTRPWGEEAGGELLLAVSPDKRLRGMVKFTGPHADRINLPLEGRWRDGRAQWTSVSPLGLTRSEVRLESLFGDPVLRARSWTNRNGKVQEWTWEARFDKPLD